MNVIFCDVFTSTRSHGYHLTTWQWYLQVGTAWKTKLYLATSNGKNYT
jgi:hypothetical protein